MTTQLTDCDSLPSFPSAPRAGLWRDERGWSSGEYAIILVVLCVGLVLAMRALSGRMNDSMASGTNALNTRMGAAINAGSARPNGCPKGSGCDSAPASSSSGQHSQPTAASTRGVAYPNQPKAPSASARNVGFPQSSGTPQPTAASATPRTTASSSHGSAASAASGSSHSGGPSAAPRAAALPGRGSPPSAVGPIGLAPAALRPASSPGLVASAPGSTPASSNTVLNAALASAAIASPNPPGATDPAAKPGVFYPPPPAQAKAAPRPAAHGGGASFSRFAETLAFHDFTAWVDSFFGGDGGAASMMNCQNLKQLGHGRWRCEDVPDLPAPVEDLKTAAPAPFEAQN
jgi:Flp pilus assembly pilin Flp